jgi:hypothetical protein
VSDRPALVCPICDVSWSTQSPRCFCDYDFETGDPQAAIRRISKQRRRASWTLSAGTLLLAALPVTFVAGLLHGPWLLLAVLIGGVQFRVGSALAWRGLVAYTASSKQLAAAKALRQLPEARVVR